ncbi:unnamed protein product [Mytilus edulis]|uniref:Homeobox domain-containing protein n=1 Tax=Mytilus edulis TaxID=6550 RepID=A0A8S3RK37_MYTED|nr:unnamed protein product [Mytilus edulis]
MAAKNILKCSQSTISELYAKASRLKSSKNSVFEAGSSYSATPTPPRKKGSKAIKFSAVQMAVLVKLYRKDDRPATKKQQLIAEVLNLEIHQIRTWFNNQRARNFPAGKEHSSQNIPDDLDIFADMQVLKRCAWNTLRLVPSHTILLTKKAFIVAHVLPGPSGPVYGRVPKGLQELFYNVDIFSNETGTVYELWCKPTVDKDEPSKPSRWSRGGGLEQPCQYVIWVGRLILEKVTKDLEELDIPYQVGLSKRRPSNLNGPG